MLSKETEEFLRKEFYAEHQSFLLEVRVELNWNKVKFRALLAAMVETCQVYAGQEMMPR